MVQNQPCWAASYVMGHPIQRQVCFVLDVPLRTCNFVPSDRVVQRVYYKVCDRKKGTQASYMYSDILAPLGTEKVAMEEKLLLFVSLNFYRIC